MKGEERKLEQSVRNKDNSQLQQLNQQLRRAEEETLSGFGGSNESQKKRSGRNTSLHSLEPVWTECGKLVGSCGLEFLEAGRMRTASLGSV